MKAIIKLSLMCALLAAFIFSCSKSSDIEDLDVPLTRADNPLLIVTPTEIVFNGDTYLQEVNIKTAGLTSLAVLTQFELTVQGMDADQFTVTQPSLSLLEILGALLGNGVNVTVEYKPVTTGEHHATLLINAALLGLIAPLQSTVPLTGITDTLGPQIVSTLPAQGDQNVNANLFTLQVTYDQNISIVNPGLITFNGNNIESLENGRNLEVFLIGLSINNYLPSDSEFNLVIRAGAIRGENGALNTNDYTLTFRTTANTPRLVSTTPSAGGVIYYDSYDEVEEKDIVFKFDRPVIKNLNIFNAITGQPISVFRTTNNPSDSTITVTLSSVYPLVPLSVRIRKEGVLDDNMNQNLEDINVSFATRVR